MITMTTRVPSASSMAQATVSLDDEIPPTITNLTYVSALISLVAYICSGYNIERRPEYPYNIVLIPFLCTMVHHYFLLSGVRKGFSPEESPALSIKSILSTAVLSGFWLIAVRIHVSMSGGLGKAGIVPTMALAKSLGTAEAIVLVGITWEAARIRFSWLQTRDRSRMEMSH